MQSDKLYAPVTFLVYCMFLFILQIFPLLLSKLGPQDDQSHDLLPWELVETALSSTMTAMANYADSEHLEEMWGVLLVSTVIHK